MDKYEWEAYFPTGGYPELVGVTTGRAKRDSTPIPDLGIIAFQQTLKGPSVVR